MFIQVEKSHEESLNLLCRKMYLGEEMPLVMCQPTSH